MRTETLRMASRFSRAAILCAAVLAAAAAPGCAHPAPRADLNVRMVLFSEPTSLSLIGNPDANSSQIASLLSDGLVGYDAQCRYVPMVARSWELSPDGLALTFHLRDGVVWHDGEPVTARDVVFTVRKVQDPATQAREWISSFTDIAAIDTPDDRTVVVRYKQPHADALDGWRVPLVPEHVAARDSDFLNGAFAQHPIGCGPFRFVDRVPEQRIEIAAFDKYWQGRPSIDGIRFEIVANDRTGYEALLLGQVDLMGLPPDLWRESLSSPRAASLARFVYYKLSVWKIDWNQDGSNPVFTDPRVRRAMVEALDRPRFAETVMAGLARPAVGSFLPESPWTDRSIAPIPFDRAASERALDEAGWRRPPGGGVREKDGKPLRFTLMIPATSQDIVDRLGAWVQESIGAVGADVHVEKVEWRAFQDRRRKHRFDAALAINVFDATPDQFDLYHSSARERGFNSGGVADPELDRLLEAGRTMTDLTARQDIYRQLQARLHELEPMSALFQTAQPVVHDARLLGVASSPQGLLAFDPGPRAWHWAGTDSNR